MAVHTEVRSAATTPPPLRVPLASFITPAAFETERRAIFNRSWLLVAHAADLPQPGSFVRRELEVPRASLLLVHGEDGRIRAFHNICRHRGNAMVREPLGKRSRLTCSFHGWTWSIDGSLRGVTDESQFPELDKNALGLLPVHCDTWNGLVFVNLDPDPTETLAAWMGGLAEGWDGHFERQHRLSSHRFEMAANWNLGVNAFTEGYHTMYIHRNTAGDYQGGASNPQRHRPFMQFMERHTLYSAPANPDHVLVPAEQVAYRWGRRLLPAACFDNDSLPPAVNPSRAAHWLFDVIEVFPNLVMLVGQHYRIEIRFLPLSADRTVVLNETFVYSPANLAERASQELFRSREREVVREDLSLLEAQHAALATGVMPEVVLSRQEMALAHHFRVRARMLEAAE